MSTTADAPAIATERAIQRRVSSSIWNDAYRKIKGDKIAVLCFFVIVAYVLMALLAQVGIIFTSFSKVNNSLAYAAPSWEHFFGTDLFGRDVLARAVHGTITALAVGTIGTIIAISIGVFLGAIAGYFGGKTDDLIVWFYTTVDTIPYILLLAAFSFILGSGLKTLYLVIGVTSWVGLCRLVRAEFMKHRSREYVLSAQALGASHMRRIFLHILPNVFHIILVNFSLLFISAIKSEVILSYLGLGVEPGTPSWGVMIDDAKLELARGVWWGLLAATIFMFGLILSLSLFNDALRDALDPKLKNK
jgi:ABC-type dipeptide/oligopeptide/nickel transport system permease subunit